MCVQYIGGCSVHRRIPWVHRRYHEYIGGCSVHLGISWCIWGIPWVHQGMFSTLGDAQYLGVFNRNWQVFTNLLPHIHHDIPWCTEHPLMYSWYPPDVLMASPRCTERPPMYSWYPPHASWYPPMYSWYPLMYSWYPRCTEHPPMYWTPPDVLNTPRCTEHTFYRVIIIIGIFCLWKEQSQCVFSPFQKCLSTFQSRGIGSNLKVMLPRANQNTPGLWGGVVRPSAGPGQSPCGDQGGEAPESSKIITF